MKPLIRRSDLSDPPRYYVLTRYRIDGNTVIASTKYDVTDQIQALLVTPDPAPEGLDVERLAVAVAHEHLGLEFSGGYSVAAERIAAEYSRLTEAER